MEQLFGNSFDLDGDGHTTIDEELLGYTSMHGQQKTTSSKSSIETKDWYNKDVTNSTSASKDDDHLGTCMLIIAPIIWVLFVVVMIKLWLSMVYD